MTPDTQNDSIKQEFKNQFPKRCLVIVDYADKPSLDMMARVVGYDKHSGAPLCRYVSKNISSWQTIHAPNATKVVDFGAIIKTVQGCEFLFLSQIVPEFSTAKYKDGRPRKWQCNKREVVLNAHSRSVFNRFQSRQASQGGK